MGYIVDVEGGFVVEKLIGFVFEVDVVEVVVVVVVVVIIVVVLVVVVKVFGTSVVPAFVETDSLDV